MARGQFFQRACAVRMHLDNGAVHRDHLKLDLDYPSPLELLEYPVQDAALGPTIHPGVDGMPIAKPAGQPPPLAALFGNVKDGIEYLNIGYADVAPLHRQVWCNELILRFA